MQFINNFHENLYPELHIRSFFDFLTIKIQSNPILLNLRRNVDY